VNLQLISQRLGSRWCCAWQVGLTLVVIGLVFSISWSARNDPSGMAQDQVVELLADGAAAIILVIASVTVFRHRRERHVPVPLVVIVWLLAIGARTLVFAIAYPDDLPRILNANVSVPVWALVAIYLFAAYDESRSRATDLTRVNEQLRQVQDQAQSLLQQEQSRLTLAVQDVIAAEIQRLRGLLALLGPSVDRESAQPERIGALADQIAAYSSNVVRETSHELRRGEQVLLGSDLSPGAAAIGRPGLLTAYGQARQPIVIPTALIVTKGISVSLVRLAPSVVVLQLLAFGAMLAVMAGGAWLIRRWLPRPTVGEVLASTLLVVLGAAVTMLIFALGRGPTADPTLIPIPTIGIYVMVLFIGARLVAAIEMRWQDLSAELLIANDQLAEANNALTTEIVRVREKLADLLHGPVQGRLAAASMSLRLYSGAREEEREADLAETVRTATVLLDAALADLDRLGRSEATHWPTIDAGISSIATTWSGLLAVTWAVDALSTCPPELIDRCVDVVAELITNASRHGGARTAHVEVSASAGSRLRIIVEDDGTGPSGPITPGSGLSAITGQGGSWDLDRTPAGRTRVSLTLTA